MSVMEKIDQWVRGLVKQDEMQSNFTAPLVAAVQAAVRSKHAREVFTNAFVDPWAVVQQRKLVYVYIRVLQVNTRCMKCCSLPEKYRYKDEFDIKPTIDESVAEPIVVVCENGMSSFYKKSSNFKSNCRHNNYNEQ
jgi:hypothetical protein